MTGRDLLCAIAGIDDGIVLASGQFSAIEASIKADQKRIRQRISAIGIAAVICIAVFGVMKFAPGSFHISAPSDTTELQTPGGYDPSETGDVAVVTEPRTTGKEEVGTTPSAEQDTTAVRKTETPSSTAGHGSQTAPTTSPDRAETQAPTAPNETSSIDTPSAEKPSAEKPSAEKPSAEKPSTTKSQESPTAPSEVPSSVAPSAEPSSVAPTTIDPPTDPEDNAFYQLYTYVIVDSAFSDYRLGKVVGEEMVGERLEDAAAAGVYVQSDGTMQEDETLRCEIFDLTGVDPEIAVCVRFIDRGKGLSTDRYYLLYPPGADMSAIEADLTP